jgi:hypothetical protein
LQDEICSLQDDFLGAHHSTEEVKKVKVGLLEKDALELHIHGEQFKRK